MTVDYENIGERIRNIRQRRKLSQETLAEIVDLSRAYISFIENGERALSLESLIDIANALKVSADDLLGENIHVKKKVPSEAISVLLADCTKEEETLLIRSMEALKKVIKYYNITRR